METATKNREDSTTTKTTTTMKEVKSGSVEETMGVIDSREPDIKVPYQLLYIVGLDWLLVVIGAIGSLVSGAIPLVFYLLIGRPLTQDDENINRLIDVLAPAGMPDPSYSKLVRGVTGLVTLAKFNTSVNELMKYMGILLAVAFAVNFVSGFCLTLAYDRVGNKIRNAYFKALVKQEIGYFDLTKTGTILKHVTDDVTYVQASFTQKIGKCCEFTAQALVGIILSFTISWSLTLITLSSGPVVAILGSIAAALNDVFSKRTNRIVANGTSIANEVVGSMRTVRSMAGEEKEARKFGVNMRRILLLTSFRSVLLGLIVGVIIGLAWCSSVITFWVGGKFVNKGTATIGELLQVLGMVALAVVGASQAMAIAPEFAKAMAAAKALMKVIVRDPAIRFKGGVTPNQLTGNIEFKNIVFRYPSRPDVAVLKNFSLSVRAGQNVALVGQSGSGKSTIVGLLERFYEAESGDVLIDGIDLKEIDPQWLHKHIGIVTQEPTLFATTIKKNITYAVSEYRKVTDEEIIEAAKAANAHDFISSLPDGYNTMLGERGVSLSGGQKQRIAIARAMIQNPSVLLLDEATSALDTESESLVQDALSRLMQGRTSIVIAHRLSTVQNSDVIVVMTRGEIVEMGKHSDLVAIPNGVYAKLAAKQMKFGKH